MNTSNDRNQINWLTAIVMAVYHILAVVALFHFSWKGVGVAAVLWWISGSLGIGIGYHRLLTHRGYRCPKWLEYFLAICGTLALEGGPIFWVGIHRIHHQLTDREGDPHSPRDGKWWSHMGWILTGQSLHQETEQLAPYVPDLRRDRFYLWLSRYHWITQVVVGARRAVFRRLEHGALGSLLAHRGRPARHLAGELRHPYVGHAALGHRRRLHQ